MCIIELLFVGLLGTPSINVIVTASYEAMEGRQYRLICSWTISEINFIYIPALQWYHNGVILIGEATRVLYLPSLALSDVGNYTCRVTATSRLLGQPIIAENQPHRVILSGEIFLSILIQL